MKEPIVTLPNPGCRWVPSRKRAVVLGIRAGLISQAEAMERYGLTAEELTARASYYDQRGEFGLRVTRLHDVRPTQRSGRLPKILTAEQRRMGMRA
jgi:hypothetical protein